MTILILGSGPAGMAAAQAACAQGEQVVMVDDNAAPGGQIWRGGARLWTDPRASRLWADLQAHRHLDYQPGARIVAATAPDELLLETPAGPRTLRWERAIVCSGARERFLPFPGWTLPGVTGAGGLQALIKGGMPVAGRRVVIAGTGPLLLASACTARKAGAQVAAIVECRTTGELARFGLGLALGHRGKLWQAAGLMAALRGVPYLHGATVVEARGEDRLTQVVLRQRGREITLGCDFLAAGFGLLPNTEAAALFGLDTRDGAIVVDAHQRSSRAGVWAAGESTGIGGVDKALAEGRIAGLRAAGATPSARELRARSNALAFGTLLARSFAPPDALRTMCRPSTLVCRCEDVSAAQLAAFSDWRSAKLQTRAGMGPCQGRVCAGACEFLFGWQPPAARPPIFPTSAATLASVAPRTKDE